MPRRSAFLLSLASLLWSASALAATVEIVVRERGGAPIRDQSVRLFREQDVFGAIWKWYRTDGEGRVEIAGVAPGSYVVMLGEIEDINLVAPENNPWAPAPKRTITAQDDHVSLLVELWRGSPVLLRWLAEPDTKSAATIVLTSEGGGSVRIQALTGERNSRVLAPGRWVASLEAPEGYVLEDLRLDGASITGAMATLELVEDARAHDVTFALAAPCRVEGRMEIVGQPLEQWTLTASLVEPGAWQQAALARGSPVPDRVAARFIDDEHYEIHLPAGRWRIEPDGGGLAASEPPFAEIALAPGETRRVDFQLRFGEDDPSTLRVRVLSPEGRPIENAHVEARAIDKAGRLAPTPMTATASPDAVFRGLTAGRYLVVAAHADFVEASEQVSIGKKGEGKRAPLTLTLGAGATLRVHAARSNGEPVAAVRIEAIHDGPLDTKLADTDFVTRKERAVARTDAGGIAEILGMYAGSYKVTGSIDEPAEGAAIVSFGDAKDGAESTIVTLSGEETRTVEAKVRPASGIVGRLRCSEGTLPAPTASIRAIPAVDARDAWEEPALRTGAVAAKDGVPLRGDTSDGFLVGPIPPGSYKVAIRPAGIEAWTWIGGTLGARDATIVHVEPGTTEDVGMVTAECGPLIVLVPRVASGEPVPELDPQRIQVEAHRPDGEKPGDLLSTKIETLGTTAIVVGLPEGSAKVRARIAHRYLLPQIIELRTTVSDLKRGKLVRFDYDFQRLGGCVDVRGGKGETVRVRDDARWPSRSEVEGGHGVVEGLEPGHYPVDLCADFECKRILRTWPDVEITAGRSTSLP